MPQQTVNIGTLADDGTGDTLRAGGGKINSNFTELYAADAALIAALAAHLADASAAHAASAISFTPAGGIAATDLQAALAELDGEKQPLNANLTSIAALTTQAYGRSVLETANAAALRTLAGLGTAALQNIGTSGANVPLLNGANTWSAAQAFTGGGQAIFNDGGAGSTAAVYAATRNAGGTSYLGIDNSTGSTFGYGLAYATLLQMAGSSAGMVLANGSGTPVMTLLTGGNVGIGTTSPAHKLEVAGRITSKFAASGEALFQGLDAADNVLMRLQRGSSANASDLLVRAYFGIAFATNNSDTVRAYINEAGNVGIGTTSPASKLHLNAAAAAEILKLTASGGGNWGIRNYIEGQSNDGFSLHDLTNDVTRFVVQQTGNVGFGTTSPDFKLVLENTAASVDMMVRQSATRGMLNTWVYNATEANAYGELSCYGGNNDIRIQAQAGGANTLINAVSGSVSVGKATAPVCKLDVEGAVRVKSYTVLTVPAANVGAGQHIFVTNETAARPAPTQTAPIGAATQIAL